MGVMEGLDLCGKILGLWTLMLLAGAWIAGNSTRVDILFYVVWAER